jgi:hypothetical protein
MEFNEIGNAFRNCVCSSLVLDSCASSIFVKNVPVVYSLHTVAYQRKCYVSLT